MRAILTYHSVDESGSVISISPASFAYHLRAIAESDVEVVSVEALLSRGDESNAIAFTFDDAFVNFSTNAWPLLRDNGFPVTLFVPTLHVGKSNNWRAMRGAEMPTLPILDWESLGLLAQEGVALGAHTRTHANLCALSDEKATDEIAGSFDDISSNTGFTASGFAYPYGKSDDRIARIAARHSDWACTTELRQLSKTDDLHRLARLDSYFLRGPARLGSYGSPLFKSYLSIRSAVRRARIR